MREVGRNDTKFECEKRETQYIPTRALSFEGGEESEGRTAAAARPAMVLLLLANNQQ
jgi:hypothetical protein